MKATISVDHRVSDGAEAAQFMQALAGFLENPVRMLILRNAELRVFGKLGVLCYAILNPWTRINFPKWTKPLSLLFHWRKPTMMRWNTGLPKLLTNG